MPLIRRTLKTRLTILCLCSDLFQWFPVCCSKSCRTLEGIQVNGDFGTKWIKKVLNSLSADPTEWSNTLEQFVGCCQRIV